MPSWFAIGHRNRLDVIAYIQTFSARWFQVNVTNLFDRLYVPNFGSGVLLNNSVPFVSVGAPRAISFTLNVAYR